MLVSELAPSVTVGLSVRVRPGRRYFQSLLLRYQYLGFPNLPLRYLCWDSPNFLLRYLHWGFPNLPLRY